MPLREAPRLSATKLPATCQTEPRSSFPPQMDQHFGTVTQSGAIGRNFSQFRPMFPSCTNLQPSTVTLRGGDHKPLWIQSAAGAEQAPELTIGFPDTLCRRLITDSSERTSWEYQSDLAPNW